MVLKAIVPKNLGMWSVYCEKMVFLFPIQLASIRRCGHTECFFFMEIGRSAKTGEGELWMQVEDSMIAQSMHEVIRW